MSNWTSIEKQVMNDLVSSAAYKENNMRRNIATSLKLAMKAQGISTNELASKMRVSRTQVNRLLHEELGGNLWLQHDFSSRRGFKSGIQIRY